MHTDSEKRLNPPRDLLGGFEVQVYRRLGCLADAPEQGQWRVHNAGRNLMQRSPLRTSSERVLKMSNQRARVVGRCTPDSRRLAAMPKSGESGHLLTSDHRIRPRSNQRRNCQLVCEISHSSHGLVVYTDL